MRNINLILDFVNCQSS